MFLLVICAMCLIVDFNNKVLADVGMCDISVPTQKVPATRLKEHLLECGYDKSVRPVTHHTNQTSVTLTMLLTGLDMDEYIKGITIHCWMIWEWKDEHLHWNPSEYGGVEVLNVNSDEIWVPEVGQFASTSLWEVETKIASGDCELRANGNIFCMPRTVYYVLCYPDLKYWPYDTMNCTLRLGAFMQPGEEITINTNDYNVDVSKYEGNREWYLLSAKAMNHLEVYELNVTFPWVQYSFYLKRYSDLYEAIIIFPAILTALMVLVTFWQIPYGSGRINLSCLCIIIHYLQLQYLGWILETNGDKPPLVVLFYRDSLVMSSLALLAAIISRYFISLATMPDWLQKVITWLLKCRAGQFLLNEKTPAPSVPGTSEEDGKEEEIEPVISTPIEEKKSWIVFSKLLDRGFFMIFLLLYIYMLSRCYV